MTTNRYKHAAVPLGGGAALVVGGSDSRDFTGRYASAERYDPQTRRFRSVGAMAERRFKLTDAVVASRPDAYWSPARRPFGGLRPRHAPVPSRRACRHLVRFRDGDRPP
jgi:hypothetical protein